MIGKVTSSKGLDPRDMPPGTLVIIYVRNSPGDNQTIESQESALVNLCHERGWKIVRIFRDRWESGKTTNREGFEYLAYVTRQKPRIAQMLIIWDFSRFGRNQDTQMFYSAEMRLNGWLIYSYRDDVPSGSMGRIFEALIAWKNEQFLVDLRLNTIRGLAFIAERGCLPVGLVCKGYRETIISLGSVARDGSERMGRRPEVDPDVAPLVVRAFEMKALGAPQNAIAKATGLYSSKSGSWNHFFSNRAYVGEYEFHGEIFTNVYPALISRELFKTVQEKIMPKATILRARKLHPRRRGSSFFLASQSVCKYCNHPMEGKSVHGHRYYVCSLHNEKSEHCPDSELLPADDAEHEILRVLLEHIVQKSYLNDLLQWTNSFLNSGLDEISLQLRALEDEFVTAQKRARKMAVAFGSMDQPSKYAEQTLRDAEALANQLESQIFDLHQQISKNRIELSPAQIEPLSTNFVAMINHGEYFDLREVIEQLCSRIVISSNEIVVEVHFPVGAI